MSVSEPPVAVAAWERMKNDIGRMMHDGWKAQKIANGFADHPYTAGWIFEEQTEEGNTMRPGCSECVLQPGPDLPPEKHHADMIAWEQLPREQQALNFSGGKLPFLVGFAAGLAAVGKDQQTATI